MQERVHTEVFGKVKERTHNNSEGGLGETLPSITSRGQSQKIRKASASPRKKLSKVRASEAEDTDGSVHNTAKKSRKRSPRRRVPRGVMEQEMTSGLTSAAGLNSNDRKQRAEAARSIDKLEMRNNKSVVRDRKISSKKFSEKPDFTMDYTQIYQPEQEREANAAPKKVRKRRRKQITFPLVIDQEGQFVTDENDDGTDTNTAMDARNNSAGSIPPHHADPRLNKPRKESGRQSKNVINYNSEIRTPQ